MSELAIEPIGPMRVTVPRGSDPDVVVTVDGATETVVKDIDWGTIIDTIATIGKAIIGGGGGGGGGLNAGQAT